MEIPWICGTLGSDSSMVSGGGYCCMHAFLRSEELIKHIHNLHFLSVNSIFTDLNLIYFHQCVDWEYQLLYIFFKLGDITPGRAPEVRRQGEAHPGAGRQPRRCHCYFYAPRRRQPGGRQPQHRPAQLDFTLEPLPWTGLVHSGSELNLTS